MIESKGSTLVISFPEVHGSACLGVFFTGVDSYEDRIPFEFGSDGRIHLNRLGRLMVHFRPSNRAVPFAILMNVNARNVITGDYSTALARMPQNYFASPPQGGVDGFFLDGSVHNFYAETEASLVNAVLTMKIHPVKRELTALWSRVLCGYRGTPISGLTLKHGGERQCEPIYEDMCAIGDWDLTHCEEIRVSLAALSS